MKPKLGSFRYNFSERRERLLSTTKGYSGFADEESLVAPLLPYSSPSLSSSSPRWWRRCGLASLFRCASDGALRWARKVQGVASAAWQLGKSDRRNILYPAKVGLAMAIITLLIYLREPFKDLTRYSVWAILTVVVVFEFTVGATLSKGFNRGIGTLSAGGLALAMAEVSKLAGEWEEVFIIASIFSTGFCSTYVKMFPSMKPYEYGFRVFLLTYCFIMVSGYNTGEFIQTAVTRFLLIALGAAVGLGVNICIYPIWAGEDLHNLVAKNFAGVATSLEGCVNNYLSCIEYERIPSKILTYQASDDPVYKGYRQAMESTSQEDTLLGFAIWEPPHGRYKMFNYPWKSYVKVSGALRHCSFMVMALHGCLLSEIQAPAERRQVFSNELRRVGAAGAAVLREVGDKVKKMERLGQVDILYEVHEAAEDLQKKIDRKSYLLVNSEYWEIGNRHDDLNLPQESLNEDNDKDKENISLLLEHKSLSEAVLDLRSVPVPTNRNSFIPNGSRTFPTHPVTFPRPAPSDKLFRKNPSWHNGLGIGGCNREPLPEESRTYESASALSLVTFTSLLIEFVARLQNLVDSYEELSNAAKFSDPPTVGLTQSVPHDGFWSHVLNFLKS